MMMTPVGLSIESLLALHQRQRQAAQAAAMAASAAAAMHHPYHPPVVPQCHPGMTHPYHHHSQCHQPVVNEDVVGIKEDDPDSEDPDQQLLLDSSVPEVAVDGSSHDEKNNNNEAGSGEVVDEADEVRPLQQRCSFHDI